MPAYDSFRFDPPAPFASVVLKNSESGNSVLDVPMLIDSGADATLIPLSYVTQLNLQARTSDVFALEGFDGNKSTAQVVRVELQFLNRAFKGEFLGIDQEYGYLGRNVLNHVPLVFDGPKAIWYELET